MTDGSQQLQREISRMRQHGAVSGWVLLHCPNERCSVQEINVWVEETHRTVVFQAPCKCVRCGTELAYDGTEPEGRRA